jgi:putative RNA 2'-phosphotransferase
MDNKDLTVRSKMLSYILRHDPAKFNIILDVNGYANVSEILLKCELSFEYLEHIVQTNDKKRFYFNDDKTKIRASQGHSIKVDLQLKFIEPPHVLYHGTSLENSIIIGISSGLNKMNRQHVHLSEDVNTAINVGKRHSKKTVPIIFKIKSKLMHFDGYKFYKSDNGVYLTEEVPLKYIEVLSDINLIK